MDWINQLGKHFLKQGALTYLITESDKNISWDGEEANKQKVDMIVIYSDRVVFIELKQTIAIHRKGIHYKQIERYHYLLRDSKFRSEFWIYVYWTKYDIVVGVKMDKVENLQVYALDNQGGLKFFASIGMNPDTRIRKKVDFKMEIEKNETL